MGRTNYAILGMGLASMLVLSLLMQQFLRKADEKRTGPLVQELTAVFGGRLDRDSVVVLEKIGDGGEHGSRAGTLPEVVQARVTIYPMMGTPVKKLAQDVGEYVWRRIGDERHLTGVVVLCQALVDQEPQEFAVPRPYMTTMTKASPPPAPGKTAPAGPTPAPGRGGR